MSGSLVFITGGTGFIGSHVIGVTLKAGYRVRVSIRKPEQAKKVTQRYPDYASNIETVVIPDLSKPENFKGAFKGVDYIFHLASPMPGSGTDVRTEYVEPAIAATLSVLKAAQEFPQIKKVVVMSSALALMPVDALFSNEATAKDNTGEVIPVDLDMDLPDNFTGHGVKYAASKILAHQATREFLSKNELHYTLLTFHPTFVLGDSLIQDSADNIDGINRLLFNSLFSEKPLMAAGAWVHVRDIADAHVKALETSAKSGTEFLLSGPVISWDDTIKFVKAKYPTLGVKLEPPFAKGWDIDVSTADRILQLKWRSAETTVQDLIDQQLSYRK